MVSRPFDPKSEQELLRILEEARSRLGDDRERFLSTACGSSPEMRRRIDRLLELSLDGEEFPFRLSFPPVSEFLEGQATSLAPGSRIGSYRLNRVLAVGGMGTVYEAEQEHPRRLVALKVMHSGLRSPSAVRRFQYESELLGRLRHPGVAQVYESGTHVDQGGVSVPWFAMEYVEGASGLLVHAREQQLDLAGALALFADVCDAVHHGHQNGIIHRDLKPSNILIDRAGRPKIIDFGVARGSSADPADSMHTLAGHVIGTLDYMSPEQAGGASEQVDVRADVYSLGAVLYELLAGQPPIALQGLPLLEAARKLHEDEPPPPRSLCPELSVDLDWIVLKALEKDRERRYASAAELAADIRRHLNDDPVLAGPPSGLYRLSKFVRRHRAVVTAGVLLLATIFLGLTALAVVQTRNLQRERGLKQEAQSNLVAARLQSAELAAQRGSWNVALGELDAALAASDSPEPALRLKRARWLIASGRRDEAKAELDGLVARAAGTDMAGGVLLLQGLLALGEVKTRNEGAGLFQQALYAGLPDADDLYARGLQATTSGEALLCFRGAIDEDPFHYFAWHGLLFSLLTSGQLQETLTAWQTVVSLFPEDITTHAYRALAATLRGHAAEALSVLETARGSLTNEDYQAIRTVVQTISSLQMALVADEQASILARLRNTALLTLGLLGATGLDQETLFVHTTPDIPFIAQSYGQLPGIAAALIVGNGQQARKLLDQAIAANPASLFYIFRAGLAALSGERDFEQAERDFACAAELEPFTPEFHLIARQGQLFAQTHLLLAGGNQQVRVRMLETLINIAADPSLTSTHLEAACWRLLDVGEHELARVVVRLWQPRDPLSPAAAAALAMVEFEAGAWEAALRAADQALALDPNQAMARSLREKAAARFAEAPAPKTEGKSP